MHNCLEILTHQILPDPKFEAKIFDCLILCYFDYRRTKQQIAKIVYYGAFFIAEKLFKT